MAEGRVAAVLGDVLGMNTRLFEACIDGVGDEDARARPGGANSIAFIFLHVVDARCYLAGLIGPPLDNPLAGYEDVRSIDDAGTLPGLDELRAAWRSVSPEVVRRVRDLAPETAADASPASFPIPNDTMLGAVAFLIQHESYHLGQLGLLRRQLGYPGLEWRE